MITNGFPKHYYTKSALFLIFITLVGFLNNYPIRNKNVVHCVYDAGLNITDSFSKFLYENKLQKNILLISSSLIEDLIALILIITWITDGKSWFLILTLAKFYLFRVVVQFFYNMPYPKNYSFGNPGFPSIVVSYLRTNDFFYSGHVGMPLISSFEFRRNNYIKLSYFCIVASLYEGFIMLSTRGHYGIDIICGWIFSIYFSVITSSYVKVIDDSSLSIDTKTPKQYFIDDDESRNSLCNKIN
jgi:hypothetical protein